MRFYPSLIKAVEDILVEIFVQNRKADKAIGGILKSNPKWGARDRAFIAEHSYEIVRNWRKIKFLSELSFIDEQNVGLFVKHYFYALEPSSDPYFNGVNIDEAKFEEIKTNPHLLYSLPDWLMEYGTKQLGKSWLKEIEAMHHQASVYLRVNHLKKTTEQLQAILAEKQIETETVPGVSSALKLVKRMNIFGSEEFKKGFFEVQDAGSQLISEYLGVKPGMRVVDACAGAGGKSLHLATLMENKGSIIAMDVEDHKLEELKTRAKRNGVFNIETKLIGPKTVKRMLETADRVLLDVPCSGIGVLKRNPDAKWKLKADFVEKIKETQADIIDRYARMLRPDGEMVYATCSLFKDENQEQVKGFLKRNEGYTLVKEQVLLPSKQGFDGYYMALIHKAK